MTNDILPFNFDIALSVVEGREDTMEEGIADAIREISGAKSSPCNSCEMICRSKGGLARHINAKHKNKTAHGNKNVASSAAKEEEEKKKKKKSCPLL